MSAADFMPHFISVPAGRHADQGPSLTAICRHKNLSRLVRPISSNGNNPLSNRSRSISSSSLGPRLFSPGNSTTAPLHKAAPPGRLLTPNRPRRCS